jgi:hypothetical protein
VRARQLGIVQQLSHLFNQGTDTYGMRESYDMSSALSGMDPNANKKKRRKACDSVWRRARAHLRQCARTA